MTAAAPDSVVVMAGIDAMPRAWRALVHEYGYTIVLSLYGDGYGIDDAMDQLRTWRDRRQSEWLATRFVTARDLRGRHDARHRG